MLLSSPSPACIAEPFNTFASNDDDDDEALQAILFASLQQEATKAAAASAVEASERAQAEQETRFNAAVKPPLVASPTKLSEIWCARRTTARHAAHAP